MRIALLTFSTPDNFGPYSHQFRSVAKILCRVHTLIWLSIANPSLPRLDVPGLPANVTFVGGNLGKQGAPVYVSQLNAAMRAHKIDACIALFDLPRIFVDELFEPYSVSWFPQHYATLDVHSRHALGAFDAVAALAPSDVLRVREVFPHKLVRYIPHVVEAEPSARFSSRREMREALHMPPDAFVALVNFANYDMHNRKAVDVSALAFRQLHDALLAEGRKSFLYIHAVDLGKPSNGRLESLDVPTICRLAGLPRDSYVVDPRRLPFEENTELMEAADVLLFPSKTEGFGMPILEAQMLGTPVVTTAFGAMKDHTVYGVSVPPLQLHWLQLGYVAMPNVSGVADALLRVAHSDLTPGARDEMQARVRETMSVDAVVQQLDALLTESKVQPQFTMLRYHTDTSNSEKQWDTRWVVIADDTQVVDSAAVELITSSADMSWETPRLDAFYFQTAETHGENTPVVADFEKGSFDRRPVVAVRTELLRSAIAQGQVTSLDQAVLMLLRSSQITFVFGGDVAVRTPQLTGSK